MTFILFLKLQVANYLREEPMHSRIVSDFRETTPGWINGSHEGHSQRQRMRRVKQTQHGTAINSHQYEAPNLWHVKVKATAGKSMDC